MSKEDLNSKTPVAPIDMTKDLSCPLLGLFGNDGRAPSPEQVNQHEAELKKPATTRRCRSLSPNSRAADAASSRPCIVVAA
jgi:hypothetical protein